MGNIEDLYVRAEQAKLCLNVGIEGTKHVDSGCVLLATGITALLKALEKSNPHAMIGTINEMTTTTGITGLAYTETEGFGQAEELVSSMAEDTTNPNAQAAQQLTAQAAEKYRNTASAVLRLGNNLEIALGMLTAVADQLEAICEDITAIREPLHEVSGAWDGPVGHLVGPLLGRQTVSGIAPAAVDALTHYQQDIAGM